MPQIHHHLPQPVEALPRRSAPTSTSVFDLQQLEVGDEDTGGPMRNSWLTNDRRVHHDIAPLIQASTMLSWGPATEYEYQPPSVIVQSVTAPSRPIQQLCTQECQTSSELSPLIADSANVTVPDAAIMTASDATALLAPTVVKLTTSKPTSQQSFDCSVWNRLCSSQVPPPLETTDESSIASPISLPRGPPAEWSIPSSEELKDKAPTPKQLEPSKEKPLPKPVTTV